MLHDVVIEQHSLRNLLISNDVLLIILSVSSMEMFIATIIVVFDAVVLLISFYLYLNKIRKKMHQGNHIKHMKMLHFYI